MFCHGGCGDYYQQVKNSITTKFSDKRFTDTKGNRKESTLQHSQFEDDERWQEQIIFVM